MIKKLIIIALLLLAVCALLFFYNSEDIKNKPKLALMTSIPLILGEASVAQLAKGEVEPAPAYQILKKYYDVVPLDAIDSRIDEFNLLLLAQSRPLSPAELIDIDKWVRGGGNIVILSDAALQWHSDYALGDKRRPLFTSLLSPLFAYWGFEQLILLDDPDQQIIKIDQYEINTVTPSQWSKISTDAPNVRCDLNGEGFEAICSIGRGHAILIADSDFINDEYWQDYAFWGEHANMQYLLGRLRINNDN